AFTLLGQRVLHGASNPFGRPKRHSQPTLTSLSRYPVLIPPCACRMCANSLPFLPRQKLLLDAFVVSLHRSTCILFPAPFIACLIINAWALSKPFVLVSQKIWKLLTGPAFGSVFNTVNW